MRRVCVTGGAGFIGSNLVDRLAAGGVEVVIVDDFRTGRREFLADALRLPSVDLVEGDVLDRAALEAGVRGLRLGVSPPGQRRRAPRARASAPRSRAEHDCHLERARGDARERCEADRVLLDGLGLWRARASSRLPRTRRFRCRPPCTRASKLAGEGLIAAYAAGYDFTGVIFRFVSILGERYTHGHVFDFFRALQRDPARLRVLGDGRQEKSYLYVAGLHRGDPRWRSDRHEDEAGRAHLQPRHRRDGRRRRLGRDHHRASGLAPRSSTRAAAAAGPATAR